MAKTKPGAKAGPEAKTPRVNPAQFIRQVRQEAAKVTWPSRKETWIASLMVFIMVTLAAIFFFFVDQILAFVVRLVLGLGS